MKIPFDIKYRPQIESGEYRVETKAGCPVRIVCWDMACELPILGLVLLNDEKAEEMAVGFTNEGSNLFGEPLYDKLFIVTPEPELSEFEKGLVKFYRTRGEIQPDKDGVFNRHEVDELLHKAASELLSLAREQFIKDGYVIEKKIFHDAVKRVDPGIMKEVSENVDMQIALRTEYEKGRADALKDLPRWRKCGEYTLRTYGEEHFEYRGDGRYLVMKGMEILLSDLEKLPKED